MAARRPLLAAVVTALVVAGTSVAALSLASEGDREPAPDQARSTGTFTFATVGDHGNGPTSATVFAAMGRIRPDFVLSLGDLAYDRGPGIAQGFCRMVKDQLNLGARRPIGDEYGETLPVAIAEGNHDDDLDQYLAPACLPDRLGVTPSGLDDAGHAYWLDYPKEEPLARLVVVPSGGQEKYAAGTRRYRWLSDTIDGARAAGLRWVILAHHKNYITAGKKPDEIGSDLFNLIVSKKVDLVLEAHDHTYQRSGQLSHASGCAVVPAGFFEPRCVVDAGTDASYAAGAGTVVLINGTGGRDNYDVSESDPDAPYFAVRMGKNTADASGFSRVTVSKASIDVRYEQAHGDVAFTDQFSISREDDPS